MCVKAIGLMGRFHTIFIIFFFLFFFGQRSAVLWSAEMKGLCWTLHVRLVSMTTVSWRPLPCDRHCPSVAHYPFGFIWRRDMSRCSWVTDMTYETKMNIIALARRKNEKRQWHHWSLSEKLRYFQLEVFRVNAQIKCSENKKCWVLHPLS